MAHRSRWVTLLSVGLAVLKELQREGAYEQLFARGRRLMDAIQASCEKAGIPVQVLGEPPAFEPWFSEEPIFDHRDSLRADPRLGFALAQPACGVPPDPSCLFGAATGEAETQEWIRLADLDFALPAARTLLTTADGKDPYVIEFRKAIRGGTEAYLLDRLLTASIIEARGAERFGLVAEALEAGELKKFYQSITRSEERHYELFLELAALYSDTSFSIDFRFKILLIL